ncbi:LysR family transcriptional regulator [Pelomonas sp. SE-A7]|uniref:LysR family transcriptional regulator n=1 Tax=Pelomonas sp. SE-A7 TaxID=3054953 RepID=UPI00259C74BE|nr:LysR family transcriptional regulator [Pelomonas sp. SE-A7]MDM4765906.1 LysR substrate-binding domain-containing protein [Pelomonas sp. SE-A7]
MKRPSLPALQAFRRVVELQSFGAAARSLETTGSSISKLVAQLEADLGVRLLNRTTRKVSISSEGAAFYADAVRILDELDVAIEAVHSGAGAPVGRLKVSLPTSFAIAWLAARLPAFMRRHPEIELDLVLNDRYVDLVQEGFDCAIRIATQLPDSSLVARRLGQVQRLLLASPTYVDGGPPLRQPQDLADHACLVYSQDGGPVEWPFSGGVALSVRGFCRVNNSVLLREMLLAGLGITLAPAFVVDDLLASGQLVEQLPAHRPRPLNVFGVMAHQRFVPRKVTAFLDFVGRELQDGATG